MSTSLPPVGADASSPIASLQPAVFKAQSELGERQIHSVETRAQPGAVEQMRATREQLEQALSEVNQRMQSNGRSLAFSLDEKADRLVIKVTNSKTGELVRQIPDETILRIAHSLEELKGALYDESA